MTHSNKTQLKLIVVFYLDKCLFHCSLICHTYHMYMHHTLFLKTGAFFCETLIKPTVCYDPWAHSVFTHFLNMYLYLYLDQYLYLWKISKAGLRSCETLVKPTGCYDPPQIPSTKGSDSIYEGLGLCSRAIYDEWPRFTLHMSRLSPARPINSDCRFRTNKWPAFKWPAKSG